MHSAYVHSALIKSLTVILVMYLEALVDWGRSYQFRNFRVNFIFVNIALKHIFVTLKICDWNMDYLHQ